MYKMYKKCRRGNHLVLRNEADVDIFRHIFQKKDIGDFYICPHVILEVKTSRYTFLTSTQRLAKIKNTYYAISPLTGEFVFLTPENFIFRCKKEGSRDCPREFRVKEVG